MSAAKDLAHAMCRDREHGSTEWTGQPCWECIEEATWSLGHLQASGWRIVRTSLDEPYQYINITDEWTPEAAT